MELYWRGDCWCIMDGEWRHFAISKDNVAACALAVKVGCELHVVRPSLSSCEAWRAARGFLADGSVLQDG